MKPVYVYLLAGLLFVFGVFVGRIYKAQVPPTTSIREANSEYKFVHPLLLTQSSIPDPSQELNTVRMAVKSYIDGAEADGKASNISVYLRDLESGRWTGVNENDQYAPGSMLKVAILLGYLQAGDDSPNILSSLYYYDPQIDEGQYFQPAKLLPRGEHTVSQLLTNMIVESDNTATIVLANAHSPIVEKVYKDLQLPDPQVGVDFMSPKQFAAFWRVLYNGTYLSHDLSEEALRLLSTTTFTQGLVAGLPKGTQVAHKFGEHTTVSPVAAPIHELHDCGIVYPKNAGPYFICIMTRGNDFKNLQTAIADTSKIVYQYMAK